MASYILQFCDNDFVKFIEQIIPVKYHQIIFDEIVARKIYIDDHVKYMINKWNFDKNIMQNMLWKSINKIHAEQQSELIQKWYNTGNYELFNDIEEKYHKMICMYTLRNENKRFSIEMIKFINDNFNGSQIKINNKNNIYVKNSSHRILIELTTKLIDSINSNVMDSEINIIVKNYIDVINSINNDTSFICNSFEIIKKLFQQNGWCENNFVCPPNRILLTNELTNIIVYVKKLIY